MLSQSDAISAHNQPIRGQAARLGSHLDWSNLDSLDIHYRNQLPQPIRLSRRRGLVISHKYQFAIKRHKINHFVKTKQYDACCGYNLPECMIFVIIQL